MRTLIAISLIVACAGLFMVLVTAPAVTRRADHMAAVKQTYIVVNASLPVHVPRLVTADGGVLAPARLKGHWSVIFIGFTACPMVCPKTLAILSAVVRDPESGVTAGTLQPVFVSIDPEHDTPDIIRSYLGHFDRHIIGLTGSPDALDSFNREIGAGSKSVGSGIDHSTSLFVLDPEGRLAGILLRPNNPAQIIADLKALRLGTNAAGRALNVR
jgi:protein SCO1